MAALSREGENRLGTEVPESMAERGLFVAELTVRHMLGEVVADAAPEEVPLLAGLEPLDDAGVDRVLKRRPQGPEPLGFGLETAVVLVTPVLWAVLSEVVKDGLTAAVEDTDRRIWRRLRRWRRRRRVRAGERLTLPSFDPEQVRRVHALVLARCAAAGIARSRATAVADGVAARLLNGTSDDDPARQPAPRP